MTVCLTNRRLPATNTQIRGAYIDSTARRFNLADISQPHGAKAAAIRYAAMSPSEFAGIHSELL